MSKRTYKWKPLSQKVRNAIYKRDKNTCQTCGYTFRKRGRIRNIHHVRGHRVTRPDSKKNLILLCHSCHTVLGLLAGHAKALLTEGRLNKIIELATIHSTAMGG